MLLHNIPKEIANPFNLTDDQIKSIRAFKRSFPYLEVGLTIERGIVTGLGFRNRDNGVYERWTAGGAIWLNIFHEGFRTFPAFDPTWITYIERS